MMKLNDYRCVVIGGHPNWVRKLRRECGNWRFIPPAPTGSIKTSAIADADLVIFFTDTVGHAVYSRYIACCRAKRIPYMYIHGVNIRRNLADIHLALEHNQPSVA